MKNERPYKAEIKIDKEKEKLSPWLVYLLMPHSL